MAQWLSVVILLVLETLELGRSSSSEELPPTSHTVFPKDFIFGATTSSYQIEGGWDEDGKGSSIWDNITHESPGFAQNFETADIAADSYHNYKQDVKLLKEIGLTMYRFSISWPRVLPTGRVSYVNVAGINYYMNLIDELLANGIQPMVTLYHWDLPQDLQDIGGWLLPEMADIFAEYADLMFETFGEKVKWWITINEPYSVAMGYGSNITAPALEDMAGIGDYMAGHNLLRAHGKAYRIYQNKYLKYSGLVSMAFGGWYCKPHSNSYRDIAAARRCYQFTYGWFAHPIFKGDYPPEMRVIIDKNSRKEHRPTSRLPYFTLQEIEEIRGSADFYGLNHYTLSLAKEGYEGKNPSHSLDMGAIISSDPSWTQSAAPWLKVVPQSLRMSVNRIKEEYNNPIVIITGNGYADNGANPTNDPERIAYYESYLAELRRAIYDDGCNIMGYFTYSLLDSFEWKEGYSLKFGIINVDMNSPNRTRTMKKSAKWLKDYVQLNQLYAVPFDYSLYIFG